MPDFRHFGLGSCALMLMATAGPAMGQANNGEIFPIDPYQMPTGLAVTDPYFSDADLNVLKTIEGFVDNPFSSNEQQDRNSDGTLVQEQSLREAGMTAETGVGEVGRRQTSADGATGQNPLYRINSRVYNRVQSRIISRIGGSDHPLPKTTSPLGQPE